MRWHLAPAARVADAEGIGPARWHLARLRPQKPRILPGGGPGCGIYQSNSKSPGKAAILPNPGQSLTRRRAAGASCPRLRPQKPRICTNRHKGGESIGITAKAPERPQFGPIRGNLLQIGGRPGWRFHGGGLFFGGKAGGPLPIINTCFADFEAGGGFGITKPGGHKGGGLFPDCLRLCGLFAYSGGLYIPLASSGRYA